jgi:hypothetical protein
MLVLGRYVVTEHTEMRCFCRNKAASEVTACLSHMEENFGTNYGIKFPGRWPCPRLTYRRSVASAGLRRSHCSSIMSIHTISP